MQVFSQGKHPVHADPASRAAAFLVDFVLLALAVTALADFGVPRGPTFAILAFAYLAGMPLTPLQGTFGKWILRIKLCDRSGGRQKPLSAVVRAAASVAWIALAFLVPPLDGLLSAAIWAVFALPWAAIGVLPHRESLFDLLAGTRVVRIRAAPEAIAGAEPQKAGIAAIGGALVAWGLFAAITTVIVGATQDSANRERVTYALHHAQPLRDKVTAFRLKEQRWPAADALGVKEWTPYPGGGGYGLEKEGSIRIRFEAAPGLKGHGITLTPVVSADGKKVEWRCRADPALKPASVPGDCRAP
jgi:uncharacterized RDD family membrane protein YckC